MGALTTACRAPNTVYGVLSSTITEGYVWQVVCNAGGGVWRNLTDNPGSFQCVR